MVISLNKLKGRSLAELRVRGSQALAAFAERHHWSALTKLPTDEALITMLGPATGSRALWSAQESLELFRVRTSPRFFSAFTDREATVGELRTRLPGVEARTIKCADRVVAGRFDLLGLTDLSFGDPIDWQLEPVSGKRAPLIHWSRLNFLDAELAGDKKITWELNRHQYFATLGRAYWFTNDERYAETFVAHLISWMEQNPPKLGINWASSLEIAFRSISWLWAFQFFKGSASFSSSTFTRALKFLYLNARHIETYLSTYFSPNTHLTGEALGLFYLGTLLPEFRAAARWRETGRQILLAQLDRHVKGDGVYFEQSSYYHRYTTDFYTHFTILERANNGSVSPQVEEKLGQLLDHLMYITRPDGTTPLFGDDDGGRLVFLDQRPANDFRAALSTGAVLFGRGDYKLIAGEASEETLWLLGLEGVREFDRLQLHEPETTSRAFSESGYYVMRDGWTPESNYLLFDCGPHGTMNCGHAHADALAIDVAANGQTVLVDPATYTYTGSKELRDWFRSSAAHNTLTADGESSSVPDGPFSWQSIAHPEVVNWLSRQRFDYVAGRHDGYQRLPAPITHTRDVLFLKHDYFLVRDRVVSKQQHRYDLWFHLETNCSLTLDGSTARCQREGHAGLEVTTFAGPGRWHREEAPVSHCYGEKAPGPVCVFSKEAAAEEFVSFLVPSAERGIPPAEVREVEAIGGRAFEVISETGVDIVMIRRDLQVEMARLTSDFDWTWVRFSRDPSSFPEELVLIGGHRLELEGREILNAERRIDYLVASRRGDQFRVETNDGILDLSLPISNLESLFAASGPILAPADLKAEI